MSTYLTASEAIDIILLNSGDILKRNKMRWLKNARYIYEDMKLNVLKQPKRETFFIDKRTNSIQLPCELTQVSSVNLRDKNTGQLFPVWMNENISDDIPDIAAGRDCSCEHNCGYKLCNTVKGYEAIVTTKIDKNPDGTDISFVCVDRKSVDKSGNYYQQLQYPQRVYESGVWVNTIKYTENIQLCQVEVDANGCVCDTEENIDSLCNTCCTDSTNAVPFGGTSENPPCNNEDIVEWKYYCNTKLDWFWYQCGCPPVGCVNPLNNIYNISSLGDRIIFPSNFGFDKVVIRFYDTTNTADIQIPLLALDAFADGLKWWDVRWNDGKQNLEPKYAAKYTQTKWGLLGQLNKRRISDWRMIFTPPVYMPSYTKTQLSNYYTNNNGNY